MKLGAFSVSLAVKNIAESKSFYANLGFEPVGGEESQGWLIIRNGETTIGLFQGMFENNIMTFNPGWDSQCNPLAEFTDVRQIQQKLIDSGVSLDATVDATSSGPGSLMVKDPDGNTILIDQHV